MPTAILAGSFDTASLRAALVISHLLIPRAGRIPPSAPSVIDWLMSITISTTAGMALAAAEPLAHSEPGVMVVTVPRPPLPVPGSPNVGPAPVPLLGLLLLLPPSTLLPSEPPQEIASRAAKAAGTAKNKLQRKVEIGIERGPPATPNESNREGRKVRR